MKVSKCTPKSVPRLRMFKGRYRRIFKKYGIKKAFIVGSVARGEATSRSDIDLALIKETNARFIKRLDGIYAELASSSLPWPVEPFVYTTNELEAMKGRPFIKHLLQDAKLIYESD